MPYIDPSASSNGSGTEASPYNSFTEINALTGDQSGAKWYIRSGTTIREQLSMSGATPAYNLSIDKYGDGEKPIIIGSEVTTGWTQEASGIWSISLAAQQCLYTPAGVRFIETFTAYANAAAFIAGGSDGEQWYDSGNATLYVATANPEGYELTTRDYCFTLNHDNLLAATASDVTTANISFKFGGKGNLALDNVNAGINVLDCESRHCGNYGVTGVSNVHIAGKDDTAPATLLNISGLYSENALNTGIEVTYVNGCTFRDSEFVGSGTNIELYGGCSNFLVDRVRAHGSIRRALSSSGTAHGNALWINAVGVAANPSTTISENNIFNYCLFYDAYLDSGENATILSLDGGGNAGIGLPNKFNNCVISNATSTKNASYKDVQVNHDEARQTEFHNCIFHTKVNAGLVFMSSNAAGNHVMEKNIFSSTGLAAQPFIKYNNIDYTGAANFAAYKTAAGSDDIDADVVFTDPDNGDYSVLSSDGDVHDAGGADVGLGSDFNQYPIYGGPNIGAYEDRLFAVQEFGNISVQE